MRITGLCLLVLMTIGGMSSARSVDGHFVVEANLLKFGIGGGTRTVRRWEALPSERALNRAVKASGRTFERSRWACSLDEAAHLTGCELSAIFPDDGRAIITADLLRRVKATVVADVRAGRRMIIDVEVGNLPADLDKPCLPGFCSTIPAPVPPPAVPI